MDGSTGRLSIGDLARLSGIAVGTIRAWETRYGRPAAERLPSGHRRYRASDVRWLRRVAEALTLGHRPAHVVSLSPARLDALLAERGTGDEPGVPARWLHLVRDFDGRGLGRSLRASWDRMGTVPFLDERLAPFLVAVGRAWADGTLSIRHEHWASDFVEDFLRSCRRSLRRRHPAAGRPGVLATLGGERHGLGVRMAALVCAERAIPARMLGVDLPADEIARAARDAKARFVGIGVSLATGGVDNDARLAELREAVPGSIPVVAGGEGAVGPRRGPRGVEVLPTMGEFDAWLERLPRPRKPSGR
jgi:methylmalonyl-CoA mutase cobalamin-binding subunit